MKKTIAAWSLSLLLLHCATLCGRLRAKFNRVLSNKTAAQFIRYVFVGGTAFVADIVSLVAFRELVFDDSRSGVYISVLLAFFIGHCVNYFGSLWFVFCDPEERKNGWTWRAFGCFSLVGGMGAGMNELGMWIGYDCFNVNYVLTKVVVSSIVVVWNFMGRKMVVKKRRG